MFRKRRILFTIPNFDTAGSGKALFNIAMRLDNNTFESHICCSHNNGEFFNIVKSSGIPVHIFQPTTPMKPRLKGFKNCLKISKYMKQLNMDLIHSFHYAPDYSEALAARMAGIPWVYTKKNMNWSGKSKNGWLMRTKLAKHIICQNKSMLHLLSKTNKVSLIPRGVNILEFKKKNKNTSLLSNLGIKQSDKVITAIANLVPVKGVELLLEAFEKLYSKTQNIYLLIVGDNQTPYAKELIQNTLRYSSRNKIKFTGKVLNVIDYYSISDVVVLTSKKESSPVTLLETMACCIPVLGSDIPGIREILAPFQTQLFSLDSKNQLVEKIYETLFESSCSINYLNQIRKHVINNYNIDLEVKRHQKLYEDILKGN